jgi:hypothetical protein
MTADPSPKNRAALLAVAVAVTLTLLIVIGQVNVVPR